MRAKDFGRFSTLGEWWKAKTGLPLPLGGNVIRKDIAPADRSAINVILRESIRYGLEHRAPGSRTRCRWRAAWTRSSRTNSSGCT